MKKLLSLLLLVSFLSKAQTTLFTQIQKTTPGYIYTAVGTGTNGVMTGTPTIPLSKITGTNVLMPSSVSLTINGSTQSLSISPSYTVGDIFSTSSYTNPSWLSSLAWSKITGTPTTLSGYGITDPIINGNLTANYIPYAVSSTSLANSPLTKSSNFIGFNTATPNYPIDLQGWYGTNSEQLSFFSGYNIGMSGTSIYMRNPQPSGQPFRWQTDGVDGVVMGSLAGGQMSLHVGNVAVNSLDGVLTVGHTGTTANLLNCMNTSSVSVFKVLQNGNVNINSLTANSILYSDGSKNVSSATLGSGITFTNGVLSATGTSSTTTLTGVNNVTVTGSAPNYTAGIITAPTFTNATHTGTTTLTGAINHSMSASVASSATVNLAALTGNYAHITGTVTITSFGTVQAGAKRDITFDGSLTLTSNTVSLILPGNSDIQTAANDVATFVSEGGGNWRCISYMRNDESYTNYTPTWTGFTSAPTIAAGEARWKMLTKNTCHVIIYPSASGTSNATTTTITLPFAAYNAGTFGLQAYSIPILNNAAQGLGSARTTSGSNVLNLYNGAIGTAWTTGGVAKSAFISIVYQIN